jgi:hypothetical protein
MGNSNQTQMTDESYDVATDVIKSVDMHSGLSGDIWSIELKKYIEPKGQFELNTDMFNRIGDDITIDSISIEPTEDEITNDDIQDALHSDYVDMTIYTKEKVLNHLNKNNSAQYGEVILYKDEDGTKNNFYVCSIYYRIEAKVTNSWGSELLYKEYEDFERAKRKVNEIEENIDELSINKLDDGRFVLYDKDEYDEREYNLEEDQPKSHSKGNFSELIIEHRQVLLMIFSFLLGILSHYYYNSLYNASFSPTSATVLVAIMYIIVWTLYDFISDFQSNQHEDIFTIYMSADTSGRHLELNELKDQDLIQKDTWMTVNIEVEDSNIIIKSVDSSSPEWVIERSESGYIDASDTLFFKKFGIYRLENNDSLIVRAIKTNKKMVRQDVIESESGKWYLLPDH